jgi:uncharacterized membrane protein YjgN (DUF898 family)
MNEMIATPQAAEPERGARVAFSGENGVFRRLVTIGALFEILTFGFYRFWLTTNMRRHLWAHTSIAGDSLEYTGRGRELLLGFLFALAVLAPIYVLFFVVSLEAARLKAFLSLPLVLFFYIFAQFAVYRARRYRLTRTIWRGVRFWMTGSAWAYAGRAFGWQLLNTATLGLSYPWSVASLERYKIGHTNYGDLPGTFVGKGWTFFKRGWWLWLLAWVPVAAFVSIIAYGISLRQAAKTKAELDFATLQIMGLVGLASLSLIMLPFIISAFKAIEWKWWIESMRFGDLRLESDIKRGAFVGTYWKMIGNSMLIIFLGLIVISIVIGVGLGSMKLSGMNPDDIGAQMKSGHFSWALAAGIFVYILSYLLLLQAIGVVRRIYLIQRIWKIVAASVTVHHLEATDHVIAEGQPASAFGEGLADGLDLAGF